MRKVTSAAREYHVFCCLCLAIGICRSAFCADVPFILNYQGKLTDNLGNAVTSGNYEVQFRIWDDATLSNAQHLIWARSFSVHVMSSGIFNILLNDNGAAVTNPGPPSVNSLRDAFNAPDRYLGMTITRTPSGPVPSPTEISPRQRLVSAPFVIRAQYANYAETAGMASNALNAELLATSYLAKASFPTLSDNPKSILKWGPGATPYKSRIVDYDGKYLVSSGTTSEPPAGVLWEVRGGAIKVTEGKLIPAAGSTNGVEWPLGSGGDADDNAWLRYSGNGSAGTLELGVGNDTNDTLAVTSSGAVQIAAASNSTLLLKGQVKTLSRIQTYTINAGSIFDEVAECDSFYLVDAGYYSECVVTITATDNQKISCSVGSRYAGFIGYWNTFVVAKGDHITIAPSNATAWVRRCQMGHAAP